MPRIVEAPTPCSVVFVLCVADFPLRHGYYLSLLFGFRYSIFFIMSNNVYPHAPIVLMVAEIRYPQPARLDQAQVRTVSDALQDWLPDFDTGVDVEIAWQGNTNGDMQQEQHREEFHRWSSTDHRTVFELHSGMMALRTTDYKGYDHARERLDTVIGLVDGMLHPTGYTRVGLRYIDEIRVPSSDVPIDWSQWVSSSLLGPRELGGTNRRIVSQEGTMVLETGQLSALAVRYGQGMGYVFDSTPELRRPMPTPGPMFKLDIDSFTLPSEQAPSFDTGTLLNTCDMLHEPIHGVFEDLITDKLRNEVLFDEQ